MPRVASASPSERRERFRPSDRIRSSGEYRALYARGRRVRLRSATLFLSPAATDRRRLGITVTRKIGVAVVRNRLKRRIREIFRRNRHLMKPGFDLVVNVRPEAVGLPYRELERELLGALK